MHKRFFVLWMLLTVISQAALADEMVSCNDGDTCKIRSSDKYKTIRKVRLSGIDAPEGGQPHWKESRDFLVKLMTGKELELQCKGSSYDRATCRIFIKTVEVNEEMVRNGMAWNYPQFSEKRYYLSEQQAREKKLGLWKLGPESSPYCYRHNRNGNCRVTKNLYQP